MQAGGKIHKALFNKIKKYRKILFIFPTLRTKLKFGWTNFAVSAGFLLSRGHPRPAMMANSNKNIETWIWLMDL